MDKYRIAVRTGKVRYFPSSKAIRFTGYPRVEIEKHTDTYAKYYQAFLDEGIIQNVQRNPEEESSDGPDLMPAVGMIAASLVLAWALWTKTHPST